MYNRLINFNQNDFLTKHQFGFRENNSTYMTILDLIVKISHQIDSKHYYFGIFLDVSKAFDNINHKVLINKIEHCDIRVIALK